MPDDGSVTLWIGDLKAGDADAAQRLWQRYFGRLVLLLGDRLRGTRRAGGIDDEEDVALSAIKSVCLGAADGRFPRLGGRDDLWGLLVVISSRKAADRTRASRRQKRGGGRVRAEADGLDPADAAPGTVLAQVIEARSPRPRFAAIVSSSSAWPSWTTRRFPTRRGS